jgi:hypothetical protein
VGSGAALTAYTYEPPDIMTPEAAAADLARFDYIPPPRPRRTLGAWRRKVATPEALIRMCAMSFDTLTQATQEAVLFLCGVEKRITEKVSRSPDARMWTHPSVTYAAAP